jgi:hypothetical protein
MATIYQDPSGAGRPYPNGGFNVPLENANAPEALQARQRAMDRATLRAGPSAAPTAPTAAAAEATGAKSAGWFKRAGDALRNPGKTLATATPTAHGVGKFAGAAARVLGPAAAGADVVSHLNDFKIDDPTNDSSLSGTFNALRKGDFSGAGRSLSKGALEAGMDLGSAAANVADIFVPGKAPVSTAYNSMLREKFGEQLVDRTGTAPAALAPQPQPAAAKVNPQAQTDWGSRPGVPAAAPASNSPSTPSGQITYDAKTKTYSDGSDSGAIPGKDGSYRAQGGLIRDQAPTVNADGSITPGTLRGSGQVSTVSTSEGYQSDLRELARLKSERAEREAGFAGNQPGGGLGGFGGATLSNSLRDKTDSGRGVTMSDLIAQKRALKQDTINAQREGNAMQAATAMQTAAMNNATLRENNANTARVNLRGHELDFERGMAPIRFQQQQRAQIADLLKSTNGDPAAAAQQALAAGRVDLAETLSKPVATMQGEAEKRDGLIENKRKEIAAGVKGAFNHMDKDGQPKMSEALEAQAIARFMRANPDFHKEGDPVKRQQMLDDALGDEELMARFSKPTSGGWASLVPNFISGNKPMLRQDNIPNAELLAKGKIGDAIGGLRGALSPDAEKGDRFFDPGDGYEAVNMGDLSARALARLEKHRKEAAERLRK